MNISAFVRTLGFLGELSPPLVYGALGGGAAIENFFPPIPADTFVLVGAFIAAEGRASLTGVFLATWACNVGSALAVYRLGHLYGPAFFQTGLGHWLLRPRQLARLGRLYERHGFKIIFLSRFLPGFRALVPVFAGVGGLGFWRSAIPLALASAIWYGVLVYLGALARRHLGVILSVLGDINTALVVVAALIAVGLGALWWKTRHHPHEAFTDEKGEG